MESSSYLMMLFVTLEQESALRDFFGERGWLFCKPDLSVTTDRLGPCIKQDPDEETALPETNVVHQTVKPTFPKIMISPVLSNASKEKTSIQRKGKQKVKSSKELIIPAKRIRSMKDKTVTSTEESDVHVHDGTQSDDVSVIKTDNNKTKQALDGTDLEIKVEDNDEEELQDMAEILDEDMDGDDDFKDDGTEKNGSLNGNTASVDNTSEKAKTQLPADNSISNENAVEANATKKKQGHKNNEPMICTICNKRFCNKSTLSKHMVRHGEKRYKCHVCSKGFFRIDEMKHHIVNVHEGKSVNLHICDVCGKMYKCKSGLDIHHQYKHGNDPKNELTCKVCNKILSCRKKRMEHERRHEIGFKFTKCDKCGRRCKNIENHQLFCSQQPVTERHKCGICASLFLSQKYLQKHMKLKHGFTYSCVACGLTFPDKKAVLDHSSSCYKVVFAETIEDAFE